LKERHYGSKENIITFVPPSRDVSPTVFTRGKEGEGEGEFTQRGSESIVRISSRFISGGEGKSPFHRRFTLTVPFLSSRGALIVINLLTRAI